MGLLGAPALAPLMLQLLLPVLVQPCLLASPALPALPQRRRTCPRLLLDTAPVNLSHTPRHSSPRGL